MSSMDSSDQEKKKCFVASKIYTLSIEKGQRALEGGRNLKKSTEVTDAKFPKGKTKEKRSTRKRGNEVLPYHKATSLTGRAFREA